MSVDLQALARWSAAVDAAYKTAGSPLRIKRIRFDARVEAFRAGMTPQEFAALPDPPLIDSALRRFSFLRSCLWSIVGFGVLLIAFLVIGSSLFKPGVGDQRSTETAAELRGRLAMGMTYDQVRSAIGEPERTQKLESSTPVGERTYESNMQFWYYRGGALQIAFEDGKVPNINPWGAATA